MISGGVDGTIKLWRMESAPGSACARKYLGHKGAVWSFVLLFFVFVFLCVFVVVSVVLGVMCVVCFV